MTQQENKQPDAKQPDALQNLLDNAPLCTHNGTAISDLSQVPAEWKITIQLSLIHI